LKRAGGERRERRKAEMGFDQKNCFPISEMTCCQKVVVKSQYQHGRETDKIMTFHGCEKRFSFTVIRWMLYFRIDTVHRPDNNGIE
jgi:hypothetical protein